MPEDQNTGTLERGVKLFQAGKFQEALTILEAHASEDALVCIMAAQAHKKLGNQTECKRCLFTAADSFDSGDAALLLAQVYMEEENYTSALTWAERANNRHTPAAGQLILRLSEKTGQWEKCLKLALESVEWLEGYDLASFCEEIATVLGGGHFPDEMILEQIGPVLDSVSDPVAKEYMETACHDAQARIDKVQEREKKAQEQAAMNQQIQQNKQEAKIAAKERAEQAAKQAAQAQKKAKAKRSLGSGLQFLVKAALFVALPIALNLVAHFFVTQSDGFLSVILTPILGLLTASVCVSVIDHLTGSELLDALEFTFVGSVKFSPVWAILGGIVYVLLPKFGPLLPMSIINCLIQQIRVFNY